MILQRISQLDEVREIAGELEPSLKQIIFTNPGFKGLASSQTLPPENLLSGGHSNTSSSLNVAPNRSRTINCRYHFYWTDAQGRRSESNDLNVAIVADYHESADSTPIIEIVHGRSEFSRTAAEKVKSKLASTGAKTRLIEQNP